MKKNQLGMVAGLGGVMVLRYAVCCAVLAERQAVIPLRSLSKRAFVPSFHDLLHSSRPSPRMLWY